jgi:hypothetical protein
LDRALAEGADPNLSPALAERARQLTHDGTRRALAASVANLLDAAEEPDAVWQCHGISTPLRRSAILHAREDLLMLSWRLTDARPAAVRGLALASLLIADEGSPLYPRGDGGEVGSWAREARAAMNLDDVPQHG